jgi:hypothetical protein
MREILAVDVAGQLELDVLRLLLAIAGKAIAPERKGERGELRIVWRIGEAIGASGKQSRQRPGQEQIFVGLVAGLEREQGSGKTAIGRRQQQMPAGFGLEAGSIGEGALACIEAFALLPPGGAVNKGYRGGGGGMAARKKDGMHGGPLAGPPC